MSPSEQHVRAELEGLQDLALVVEDPRMAEQMFLVVGAVTKVWELHQVDSKNKCLRCRAPGRRVMRRQRQPCTVREVYDKFRLKVSSRDEEAPHRADGGER